MASLIAEPARPEVRKTQHLPPKSYSDAAAEGPTVATSDKSFQKPATINGTNGTHSEVWLDADTSASTDADTDSSKHTISVLRITNTGAERKEEAVEKAKPKTSKPDLQRQESKRVYSATGLDDSPKAVPRHRKSSIKKQSGRQKHERPGSNGSSSTQTSEPSSELAADKSLFEKVRDELSTEDPAEQEAVFEMVKGDLNGSDLTSIKPTKEYETQMERDKEQARHQDNPKLVSGRQAGQRWQRSGIRFAPMNVPLQRRLQTFLVLFHTLILASSIALFFFLCALPILWPIMIPYLIYTLTSKASTSGELSRRSDFIRSLPVWSLFASYFPARLHRTQELPATRKYIFGYHPHGIISHGAFAAFATEALGFGQLFPGIKNSLLTLDSNFRIPLYREYALSMGLASVSREACENILTKGGPNKEGMGRAITIVVGGARESLDAQPYSLRLVLKRRKGFVKLAIRTGADLVPVLAFGENDLYDQVTSDTHPKVHKLQLMVKKFCGFTVPLFHARGIFNYDVGMMPYRRPLNIVVGRPIKVVETASPSQEEIDRVHEEYVTELESIWTQWKDKFAPDRKEEMQILE